MLRRALCLLLFICAPGAWAQAPEARTDAWSLERLDLDVTVDPGKGITVRGTMVVRLEDETSNGLTFALNSRKMAVRFRSLEAGGVPASIRRYSEDRPIDAAFVTMPQALHRGDTLDVTFIAESEMESAQLHVGTEAAFASWVERWYPLPASVLKGTTAPAAPGSTTFHLPAGWRSVSNGSLESSSVDGERRTERWVTQVPAARSFVAAAFSPVVSVESGGRRIAFHLLHPRKSAEAQARALARSLQVMESRFGPYPYATYDVAEVPEGSSFAASSEQGFIMVRSSVLDDAGASLPFFAHEAAHGWWGNLVRTEGPGAKMLSEALAQYGAVLSIEAIEGVEARNRFLRFSRAGYAPVQSALGYFFIWRQGGDKPLALLSNERWDQDLSDSKGMWFYHMLRERVGDEVFFSTLRSILRQFAGKEVTVGDLRASFLGAANDPSLDSFFAQWLDRTGAPVIKADWWSTNRARAAEIHLEQLQGREPFSIPLEIAIDLVDGTTVVEKIALSERTKNVTVPTTAPPVAVRLDPDHRILMWGPEYGPRPER